MNDKRDISFDFFSEDYITIDGKEKGFRKVLSLFNGRKDDSCLFFLHKLTYFVNTIFG